MTWLVYASSSPVDTINRMATGRWSVRPDSWVMKLNSSTSWGWGKRSILIRRKGHHAEARVGSGLGLAGLLKGRGVGGSRGPQRSLGLAGLTFRGELSAVEGYRAQGPLSMGMAWLPDPRLTAFQSGHSPSSAYSM